MALSFSWTISPELLYQLNSEEQGTKEWTSERKIQKLNMKHYYFFLMNVFIMLEVGLR